MLSFLFLHFYCIIFLHVLLENSFNIYTKCPSNGTLSNTKTHMRDATEWINSIGYAFFAVKVSKGAKIRNRYNQVMRYSATQMIWKCLWIISLNEPLHEISNNVVCATSRASDQPAHRRSMIRAFASRLNILWIFSHCPNSILTV